MRNKWWGVLVCLVCVVVSRGQGAVPGALEVGSALGQDSEESVDDLIAILRSGDKGKRRAAVNKLVKLDTKAAWLGVIEALGNENAPAADEAQLDLADLSDEKLFDSLWGRAGLGSKTRIVQLRVAELFGRRSVGIEAKRFKKALGERDDEVRRLLLWSLERQAREGWLLGDPQRELASDLIKMMRRDGDPAVRGAALFACVEILGSEASRQWIETVSKDKAPEARCAAAYHVGLLEAADARVLVAKLLGDDEPSVRRAAVTGAKSLARLGDVEVLEALIERLEAEPRPRIVWGIVDVLRSVSGLQHRRDPRPWRAWLTSLEEDWIPSPPQTERRAFEADEGTVAFAGLPILSDRVAFLIDLSGSIWNEKNGKLPKDLAGAELDRALDMLRPETLFNVMPYTNTPFPWMEELVLAKPKAVEEAKAYFADCRERGAGNVYDAIALALEDLRCDSLVILTDGAPSGGTRWNLNLLVPALLEANRYRAVAFDSLLVGASGGLTRHWERLAAESGGQCISIELK